MPFRFRRAIFSALLLTVAPHALAAPASPAASEAPQIDLKTEEFTLPNGLRVLVHTDRKAPVVAVNIWYHVGSRNEVPGRTGFAHLFEHLMFQGSENYRGEFFEPFEMVGKSDQNGTTHFDRTNYFQTVPTTALDMALWMESDRMGHFLGALDQKTLDEQRDVVKNEKRQRAAIPYAMSGERTFAAVFPAGHPYHTPPIGSMADLDRASLTDVQAWFKSWYGPNNAVLVLAGDIDVKTARAKVARYFGDIPASATVPKMTVPIKRLDKDVRETMTDLVTRTLVVRTFVGPADNSEDAVLLEMAAISLGAGDGSRLNDRLVMRDQVADGASAGYVGMDLGGMFQLNAYVKEGQSAEQAQKALDEELARFLANGPTAEEVRIAKTLENVALVRRIERVSGKADLLNGCVSSTGRPDCWRTKLDMVAAATPEKIGAAARRWLTGPSHLLAVLPGKDPATSSTDADGKSMAPPPMVVPPADPRFKTLPAVVDRSTGVPKTDHFPEFKLPPQQHATLSNGLKVVLVERHEIPLVSLRLDFLGGEAVDVVKPGVARFALSVLNKGAGSYTTQGLAQRQLEIGAQLSINITNDAASLSLQAMADRLPESLDLLAAVVLRPAFSQSEIDRSRKAIIAGLKQAKLTPEILGTIASEQLYGPSHPYNARLTEENYNALTRDDLVAYQQKWLRPEIGTLTIAGDTTLAEIMPLLEARFGTWPRVGKAGVVPNIPRVASPVRARVVLIDQPGAQQSTVMAAKLVSPTADADADIFDAATQVLGGGFVSRLNLNLREDKHWSYGAGAGGGAAIGQRVWRAQARVQTDKTAESMAEIQKEIIALRIGTKPITDAEMARIKASVFAYPSAFESLATFNTAIAAGKLYGKPEDYLERYVQLVGSMKPGDAQAAFAKEIDPGALTWFVMGDLSKIEAPVRALGIGDVIVVDADGKPVERP
jgi:zinc protease